MAGIPRKATEDDLKEKFGKFGEIKHCHVIKDHNTGNSRGFGYILFSAPEQARAAIAEMDKTKVFNDWEIKVEPAKQPKDGNAYEKQNRKPFDDRQRYDRPRFDDRRDYGSYDRPARDYPRRDY